MVIDLELCNVNVFVFKVGHITALKCLSNIYQILSQRKNIQFSFFLE